MRTDDWVARIEPSWPGAADDLFALLEDGGERFGVWISMLLSRAEGAAARLAEALESDDRSARSRALLAARAFGAHREELAPLVAERLEREEDPVLRYRAAFALGGLVPASFPTLVEALGDADPRVRRAAVEGIEKALWPHRTGARSYELGIFAEWHGLSGRQVAETEATDTFPEQGVLALGRALGDPAEDVRALAALALHELGPRAELALDELRAAAEDGSPAVALLARAAVERLEAGRWSMLRELREVARRARWNGAASESEEELVRELDHGAVWVEPDKWNQWSWSSEPDVRWRAAVALVTRSLDDLVARAEGEDEEDAAAARAVLASIEREVERRIQALLRIVDDTMQEGDPAARELVALGPVALPAVAHDFLRYPRFPIGPPTYIELAWVIRAQGEAALPTLIEGLEHWRVSGRQFAADGLARLGPRAAPAMPFVLSAWRTEGRDPRLPGEDRHWEEPISMDPVLGPPARSAVELAAAIGADALPHLERGMRDLHATVRMRSCAGIGGLGPEAAGALPELLFAMREDEEQDVRVAAARAILAVAPEESLPYREARDAVGDRQDR